MEVDDASVSTAKSWAKRLIKFVKSYKLEDVWNIDELGHSSNFYLIIG